VLWGRDIAVTAEKLAEIVDEKISGDRYEVGISSPPA
jgi:hypothetical protein